MKTWVMAVALTSFLCASAGAQEAKPAAQEAAAKPVYWCEVCHKVSLEAGKCDNADMAKMHVLSIAEGMAKLCACAPECKCTVSLENPRKCSCDKDVVTGNLRGLFVCEKDKAISDKAGKCPACGADLVELKPKLAQPEPPANIEKPKKHTPKGGKGRQRKDPPATF